MEDHSNVAECTATIRDALAEDARCRRPGVTEGLYSITVVGERSELPHCLPCVRALRFWEGELDAATDQEFRDALIGAQRVFEEFSLMDHGMVLAGGAVRSFLLGEMLPHDYDLFLYEHTEASALDAIEAFYNVLIELTDSVEVYRTASCVTFTTCHNTDTVSIFQVILRLYSTKAEVIHGFDLGASAALWDGERVLLTRLGLLAYRHGINVVNLPARRGASYEKRLARYFDLGFSIVFPDLTSDMLISTGDDNYYIPLRYMTIYASGGCLCGLEGQNIELPTVRSANLLGVPVRADENRPAEDYFFNQADLSYQSRRGMLISNLVEIDLRGEDTCHLCAIATRQTEGVYTPPLELASVNQIYSVDLIERALKAAVQWPSINVAQAFTVLGPMASLLMTIALQGHVAVENQIHGMAVSRVQQLDDLNIQMPPLRFSRATDATALVSSDMTPAEWYTADS